jgi:hypothetical protein
MLRLTGLLWLALFAGIVLSRRAEAQLTYPHPSGPVEVRAIQLWYNGFWKHPGWINGTLVDVDAEGSVPIQNNIAVIVGVLAPYEKVIRKYTELGAKAILILRDRGGTPGQGMYLIDGSDQKSLNVPVVEVYQFKTAKKSLYEAMKNHLSTGLPVTIWPQTNEWKTCNENAFQAVWNVILSFMEILILMVAFKRLHEWWEAPRLSVVSIGPICIILEVISALIRLAYTSVDPFWSYRMLPDLGSQILMTAHLPFMFSSGILLTFFWAETLLTTRIKVSPFISEYRKSAFAVIAMLFVLEIACTTARLLVPVTSFNPGYLVQVFYVLVAIVLTVCYLVCAIQLARRLQAISKRKVYIRQMALRFSISTSGYILIIITIALSLAFISNPWGRKILSNGLFLGANLTALLQVYSFRPPTASLGTTTSSNGASGSYQDAKLPPTAIRHRSSNRHSAGPPAHSASITNLTFPTQRPINEYESTEEGMPSSRLKQITTDDSERGEEESSEYLPMDDHPTLTRSARRTHDSLETTSEESNLGGPASLAMDDAKINFGSPSSQNSLNSQDSQDSTRESKVSKDQDSTSSSTDDSHF